MNTSTQGLFIGIDLGTSGARAIAIDTNGTPHGDGRCALPESDRRDPSAWWNAVSTALQQLLSQIDRTHVRAIAIDATSGTVLAISADGTPLTQALMYNDAVEDQATLRAIANVAPATSAVHGASSALARAITLQQQVAEKHGSHDNTFIVHQADWLAGQLSGHYTTSDESNALKTGYDPVARHWPDWIATTGMNPNLLPSVQPCGTSHRAISKPAAQQFQLPDNTALVTGATDGCASFLATGANTIGDCVTALGTTITMKMLSDKPLFAPEYGIYSHRIGDMWLAGGASNSGGNVLAAHFTNDKLAEYSAQINPQQSPGLNYYPLVKPGERFPHNDANWQPCISPRPSSNVEFLHALFEGMADIEALGYQRLQSLGAPAPTSVRTVGGGAGNAKWSAIRQLKLNVPFSDSESSDAAVGMAQLARQALRQQ